MLEFKQMCCCWCFKVFFRVLANLTNRVLKELLDMGYKMCAVLCCCRCCYAEDHFKDTDDSIKQRMSDDEDFFKAVSRRSAEDLLENKQNGTFIIRPSKNSNLGILSVIQDDKIFHLNIRRRQDGLIALGNEKTNEKCFKDLDCLINYYISNYLVLYSNKEKSSTLLLPFRGT